MPAQETASLKYFHRSFAANDHCGKYAWKKADPFLAKLAEHGIGPGRVQILTMPGNPGAPYPTVEVCYWHEQEIEHTDEK